MGIYHCSICDFNFCLSCLSGHDNSHKIVDINAKYNFCPEHHEIYSSHCKTCEKNICPSCNHSHSYHDIIDLNDIYERKEKMNIISEELGENVLELRNIFSDLKSYLFKEGEIVNNLYIVLDNFITHYDPKLKNYQYMKNFILVKEKIDALMKEIKNIKNSETFQLKLISISQLYFLLHDMYDNRNLEREDNSKDFKLSSLSKFLLSYISCNKKYNCEIEINFN